MPEASIPSPTVSYFKLGPLTIHFYALTMLCAIVFAVLILTLRWKRWGGTFDQVLDFTLAAVPCGLVAARIYNCLTVPWDYFPPTGNPINILKVWNGGMAIFGSLMGGAIAIALVGKHKKIPSLLLADAVAPGLL
ncbi:MAG: prolipoprotein diacylglyceryl transferase, partial [Aeriscardovia sp.]|nr:prolipoprotein diacylglyceryl transferase [Aeriscardovia sp.]